MELISLPLVLLLISSIHSQYTADIKPILTVHPQTSVFTGDTVTLTCVVHSWYTGWEFVFSRPEYPSYHEYLPYPVFPPYPAFPPFPAFPPYPAYHAYYEPTVTKTILSLQVSDGGQYLCGVISRNLPFYTQYSEPVIVTVHGKYFYSLCSDTLFCKTVNECQLNRPKPQLSVRPGEHVVIGDTVTLTCDINGGGVSSWQYSWYKDSQSSTVSKLQNYTIRSVIESDAGKYTCRGTEIRGSRYSHISNEVTLTVSDIPRPTLNVQPQTPVFIGDKVTLICKVCQSTGWEFIFINPSNTESTETTGTKTIRSVRVSDGGEYKCRARRRENPHVYTQYSQPITVTIHERPTPQVSVWPADHVFRGETVNLTCVINGGGVSSWQYSWYKDSIIQQNKLQYYTIRSVTESDAGKYTCRGKEIRGSRYSHISNAVTLRVSALPKITVRVTPDRSVFTGETVTLKCEIEDQYRSLNWRYLWYKDTTEVFNSGHYTVKRDSLTINGVTQSDKDRFWCRGERDGRPQTSQPSTSVYLTVKGSKPKPKLTSDTEGSVLTGNTVTLKCHIDQSNAWTFYWYKHTQNFERTTTETNSYTIHSVRVSDGGQYWCRAGRGKPDYYTDYSDGLWINVKESPKPVVSVDPDTQLFRGETVTLRCDIQDTGDTEWTYSWTVEKRNNRNMITQCNTQECKINNIQPYNSGKYTCRGKIREQNTEISDAVTLTVSSDKPQTVLRVSPDRWLTEGDSVTLMCEVKNSSTGWTFSWFTEQSPSSDGYQLLSDSIRGSKGIYTVSSVTGKHTGVYMCRAERGDPVYHTEYSNTKPLFVTGEFITHNCKI
ncbi:cell adhesion molecule CEACAM5-like [Misgurnus anguillicaudatus]|uniref:cell adhesion molecule CEACAM5-like n=1 Tax=Misgurnus anguillicaudatus TaxID=75329 RepID=UPI003CCFCA76